MKLLVTGAGGFIGRAVVARLASHDGVRVLASSRSRVAENPRVSWVATPDYVRQVDWRPFVLGADAVVHLAGRVHVLRDRDPDADQEYLAVNRDTTRNLAAQAAEFGVRRLVIVSTIGVLGRSTTLGSALSEDSPAQPYDAYTRSKLAAEDAAVAASAGTEMSVTIIRPPLVYGPNAPGNFGRLVRMVRSGIPLPLASVANLRSMIALENLTDLIVRSVTDSRACGKRLLASDGDDLSTPDIIREIARGLRTNPRLYHFPVRMLQFGLAATGKYDVFTRLCGSLRVDASTTRSLLDWNPPVAAREAIQRAARETRV